MLNTPASETRHDKLATPLTSVIYFLLLLTRTLFLTGDLKPCQLEALEKRTKQRKKQRSSHYTGQNEHRHRNVRFAWIVRHCAVLYYLYLLQTTNLS
jgi:hypothetical protein